MMWYLASYLTCGLLVPSALAASKFQPCPPLGPFLPMPPAEVINSSPAVQKALKSLDAIFDKGVSSGIGAHGGIDANSSFSVSLFSTSNADGEAAPFFHEYHYTAPALKKHGTGVSKINAQSVYRLGDLSQLFTIWTVLIEAGDRVWNELVVKFVPELAQLAKTFSEAQNSVDEVDWQQVTVGELASHLAGIGRDYTADVSNQNLDFTALGFPELSRRDVPKCGLSRPCSRKEFFSEFTARPPVVAPSQTPVFSSAAFQILAYVVECIAGKPFATLLQESIIDKLNLEHTSLNAPVHDAEGVIPINETVSGWSRDYGDESPALGMFTSLTDLSRAGAAILASSLVDASTTRRWFKPNTLTSNAANSVGMPWTLYSLPVGETRLITEVFTVFGGTGRYSSYIGLLPSYGIGFALLSAGQKGRPDLNAHADIVGDKIFPAVVETAAGYAKQAFEGTYQGTVDGKPASLKIALSDELGMEITELTRDGVDVMVSLAKLKGIKPKALSMRIYPSGLQSTAQDGSSKAAWRAIFQDKDDLADGGTPTCVSWMDIDMLTYGGEALDRFVFGIGKQGLAESIEIPALRMTLKKVSAD